MKRKLNALLIATYFRAGRVEAVVFVVNVLVIPPGRR
jgi:hypothetical protein